MKYILLTYIIILTSVSSITAQLGLPGIPYRKGDLWGLADKFSGEILVDPIYDTIYLDKIKSNFIPVLRKKKGVIKYNSKQADYIDVLAPEFDFVFSKRKGYITVKFKGKPQIPRSSIREYYKDNPDPFNVGFYSLEGGQLLENKYLYIQYEKSYLIVYNRSDYCAVYSLKEKKFISDFEFKVNSIEMLSNTEIINGFEDRDGNMFRFKDDSLILLKNETFVFDEDIEDVFDFSQNEKKKQDSRFIIHPISASCVCTDSLFYSKKKYKVNKVKFFESNFCDSTISIIKHHKTDKVGLLDKNNRELLTSLEFDSISILYVNSDYTGIKESIDHFEVRLKEIMITLENSTDSIEIEKNKVWLEKYKIRITEFKLELKKAVFFSIYILHEGGEMRILMDNNRVSQNLYKRILFNERAQYIELVDSNNLSTLCFRNLSEYKTYSAEYFNAVENSKSYFPLQGRYKAWEPAKSFMISDKDRFRINTDSPTSPFKSYLVVDESGKSYYIGNNGLIFHEE